MSRLKTVYDKGLSNVPKWIIPNLMYETITGSQAYGTKQEDSDEDIYGFCIPPKEVVFPHQIGGEIEGFGRQKNRFKLFQQHHVEDKNTGKMYDFSIYNIVHYFHLCMENNPNMIDTLFTPRICVTHSTQISELLREKRCMFLHKGSWFKFKGYAYSQITKMQSQNREGKRKEVVEKWGFDLKFASHVVRLLGEIEQILIEGDLDLQRNREQLKSIRRGEWTKEQIIDYFNHKEKELETAYINSKLPNYPDEEKIKELLLNCLESHYGVLDKVIQNPNKYQNAFKEMETIIEKYK